MPMDNIGKPNIHKGLKTGLKPLTRATPKKASVHGDIASNHTILSVRSGGNSPHAGRMRKKPRMY